MNSDIFIDSLKDFPSDLDTEKIRFWLKYFPDIEKIAEIEKLFLFKTDIQLYYKALKVLFAQKYLRQEQLYQSFEGSMLEEISCEDHNDNLCRVNLFGSKAKKIVFKECSNLDTMIIWSCYNLSELNFTNIKRIKSFHFQNLRKLTTLKIENKKDIKYFSITQCNSFANFDIIKDMNNLLYLDLSQNKNLSDLSFLKDKDKLLMLNINTPNILKKAENFDFLEDLPSLKFINILGTKKEKELLKEKLPNCFGIF